MSDTPAQCPELPAPPGRIVLFSLLALALGVGVALWLDRPAGPRCYGSVASRSISLRATGTGTVRELLLGPGAPAEPGIPLLVLEDAELARSIRNQQQLLVTLEAEFQRAVAQAELESEWRMRQLEAEICDIQLKSASYLKEKYDFELQRSMLDDVLNGHRVAMAGDAQQGLFAPIILENLATGSQRLTTMMQMESAANAAEVSSVQVEICEQRQQQLELVKQELPQQIRKTAGVDSAEARLAAAREELARLEAREQELTILSPAIGKVGLYHVKPGDHLNRGDRIVDLLDDEQRYLVVDVPSQQITRFPVGTKLALTFPGRVQRLGTVTEVAPQAHADRSLDADAMIPIQVGPLGAVWPEVPIGSRVVVHLAKTR